MNIINVLPLADYSEGEHIITEQNIPDDSGLFIGARIARCTTETPDVWDSKDIKIRLKIEASFDNGETWVYGGSAESIGGIYSNREGIEPPYSIYRTVIPDGTNRKIRGTLVITGGNTKTAIDFLYGVG
jgi:hypothetical protein